MTLPGRFAQALADVGYVDPHPTEQYQLVDADRIIVALRERGVAVFDADTLINALRFVAHQARLCNSSDYWHAIAHDDADEDGYRTILAANLHSAIADRVSLADAIASENQ